ncbi:MAG: PIN domain-containing protein [Firmicutes bacterium]|nr:PIN domain-containing protein [Bacillota bacterium]
MRIVLDTNIVIDILQKREPFFADSYLVLRNALENGDLCMMPVSAMTDVAYILRKNPNVREKLVDISGMLTITDVTDEDFEDAVASEIPDFEDAFLAANAKRNRADCIVTRNAADFARSQVTALTPQEFLAEHCSPAK